MQVGNVRMARFGLVGANIGSRSLPFPKSSSNSHTYSRTRRKTTVRETLHRGAA